MANRRMFARTVTESDDFLELPQGAQLLWFHLGLSADDDGFLNSVKRVMRLCGATEKDLAALVDSGFLLSFDSGVYLIRDWLLNNQLRQDRYHETTFKKEKSLVEITEGKQYTWLPDGCQAVAAVKDRLGEDSQGEASPDEPRQSQISQDEAREGGAGEGSPPLTAPCPVCGQVCAVAMEGHGLHLWCPDCGDFMSFDGSDFQKFY